MISWSSCRFSLWKILSLFDSSSSNIFTNDFLLTFAFRTPSNWITLSFRRGKAKKFCLVSTPVEFAFQAIMIHLLEERASGDDENFINNDDSCFFNFHKSMFDNLLRRFPPFSFYIQRNFYGLAWRGAINVEPKEGEKKSESFAAPGLKRKFSVCLRVEKSPKLKLLLKGWKDDEQESLDNLFNELQFQAIRHLCSQLLPPLLPCSS